MHIRARKALGCSLLLAYLALYVGAAASVGAWLLPRAPAWAEFIYYVVAGLVWVAPLKPLFAWMNKDT